jgi:hypothetical protein
VSFYTDFCSTVVLSAYCAPNAERVFFNKSDSPDFAFQNKQSRVCLENNSALYLPL